MLLIAILAIVYRVNKPNRRNLFISSPQDANRIARHPSDRAFAERTMP